MNHSLKCWPGPFEAIDADAKTFEFRSESDRRFAVGDNLDLMEWDPSDESYTGRHLCARVRYLLRGPAFGIPEGFVCMSIKVNR